MELEGAAVVAIDEVGNITHFNQAAEKLFGHTSQSVLSKCVSILLPEEEVALHHDKLKRYLEEDSKDIALHRIGTVSARHADSRIVPLELLVVRLHDSDDHHHSVLGVCLPVVSVPKQEEVLSRKLERNVVERITGAHTSFVVTTPTGVVVLFNRGASEMFGFSAIEVLGKPLSFLFPTVGFDAAFCHRQPTTVRLPGRRKNGESFPAEIHLVPHRLHQQQAEGDSSPFFFKMIVRETPPQVDTLSTAILNSSIDAVISVTETGNIVLFNSSAQRMFGYSEAELLRSNVKILMPERIAEHHDEYMRRYVLERTPRILGTVRETVARRADGCEFPIELSISECRPINPESTSCVYFVAIIRDIRERKRLEESYMHQQLLFRILPPGIASQLTNDSSRIAEVLDSVCVIFADVVHFTELSNSMDALALIQLLDNIFSMFDDIIHKFGLTKVKTVGDAYMCVCGAPEPVDRPAEAACRCVLAMLQAFNEQFGPLEIRIGLHLGSVTAGVIGSSVPAYDLWGRTVNVASRMESHGIPGRIQTTKQVVDACDTLFAFEERSTVIDVKGIGPMQTYFLLEERMAPPPTAVARPYRSPLCLASAGDTNSTSVTPRSSGADRLTVPELTLGN